MKCELYQCATLSLSRENEMFILLRQLCTNCQDVAMLHKACGSIASYSMKLLANHPYKIDKDLMS